MDNNTSNNSRNTPLFELSTLGLVLIVSHSFLLHLFTRIASGYVYSILLIIYTLIYVFGKRMHVRFRNKFALIWLIVVVTFVNSFLHSQRSNGALLDGIVFVCGLLLIEFYSRNAILYVKCINIVKVLALFFSFGVLIQRFLPTIYRLVVAVFPTAYRVSLVTGEHSGFALNPGYSAGYIISGVFVLLSELIVFQRSKVSRVIVLSILLLSLLLTGKRGPLMFLVLTVLFCYLGPVKGLKKFKRYWIVFSVVILIVILMWAFREVLLLIPIFGRILNSVAGFLDGEDITSGRTRLYLWAIELFRQNPIFGIGWGRYRTTVVGNVTVAKDLETHNIYLQLLAETGIVGFAVFVMTFLFFWNTTRIAYCKWYRRQIFHNPEWKLLLHFSLAYQTYFLLYGLTGNPLYDPHFQIMYFFSCLIIVAFKSEEKNIYQIS